MFQLSTVWYWSWECLSLAHSVTVERNWLEFSSFRGCRPIAIWWVNLNQIVTLKNRQDAMTRRRKDSKQQKISDDSVIQRRTIRESREDKKKIVWAVPHVLRISSLQTLMDGSEVLGGPNGGRVGVRRSCWLAWRHFVFGLFCVLSHKNKRRRKIKR